MSEESFPLKDETYQIIGACMEVHRELGHGFREVIYQDAVESEFRRREISYQREKNIMSITRVKGFLTFSMPTS